MTYMTEDDSIQAVDTNVLIYAIDDDQPQKRHKARAILEDAVASKLQLAVTNQILAEFSDVVTSKITHPLSKDEAKLFVSAILSNSNFHVYDYTSKTVLNALDSDKPFWDSLIAETLKENGIRTIITENTKDFKGTGLLVKNPFASHK
jgi:predicted nucleic acid-binding protein